MGEEIVIRKSNRSDNDRKRTAPRFGEKVHEGDTGYKIEQINYAHDDEKEPKGHPQKDITERRKIG